MNKDILIFIAEERVRQGYSIRSLAKKVGMHHPQIVRVEGGTAGLRNIEKVLDALGYELQIVKKSN